MSFKQATFDLLSIVLLWVGTGVITLVGVPAALPRSLTTESGSIITTESGEPLEIEPDHAATAAKERYFRWAIFGMLLITLGMAWQARESILIVIKGLSEFWSKT